VDTDTNNLFSQVEFSDRNQIWIDHDMSNSDIRCIQNLEIQLWISEYEHEYDTHEFGYKMLGFGYDLTICVSDPFDRMDRKIVFVPLSTLVLRTNGMNPL
jgi:hypothetical protein